MWIPRSKHDPLRRLSLKRMVSRHEVAEIGPAIAVTVFLARMLAGAGLKVGLAAHNIDKLKLLSPICGQPWRKIIDTPFRGLYLSVYGTKIA
jgi:hypothetical protein